MFSIINIIITILIGAFVGWLAGNLMKSKHGFWMSALLGIIGSFIGFGLAGMLGIGSHGLISTVLIEIAGTCILIAVVRAILGKKF